MGCHDDLVVQELAGAGETIDAAWTGARDPAALTWLAFRVAHELPARCAVVTAFLHLVGVSAAGESLGEVIQALDLRAGELRSALLTAERIAVGAQRSAPRPERAALLVVEASALTLAGRWPARAADKARDAVRELIALGRGPDALAELLRSEIPLPTFSTSWRRPVD